jgi:hypothetical protein
MKTKQIHFDDLPQFSHWPRRLLSLDKMEVKVKNEAEVEREFNRDKWGELLSVARSGGNKGLREIENTDAPFKNKTIFFENDRFFFTNEKYVLDRHLKLYENVLKKYSKEASCLVELGAGYGSKIFELARRPAFRHLPLIAGEFTENGRELIKHVSRKEKIAIEVGYCDFFKLVMKDIKIPPNALIFTSYSVHYVPELSKSFTDFLRQYKPCAVVHFEPCFEHFSDESLHDLLCQRYMELNDYTRNLRSVIVEGVKKKTIKILKEKKKVMGTPFLPLSIIEWKPL